MFLPLVKSDFSSSSSSSPATRFTLPIVPVDSFRCPSCDTESTLSLIIAEIAFDWPGNFFSPSPATSSSSSSFHALLLLLLLLPLLLLSLVAVLLHFVFRSTRSRLFRVFVSSTLLSSSSPASFFLFFFLFVSRVENFTSDHFVIVTHLMLQEGLSITHKLSFYMMHHAHRDTLNTGACCTETVRWSEKKERTKDRPQKYKWAQ